MPSTIGSIADGVLPLRPPWWILVLATLFIGYHVLLLHSDLTRPEPIDFVLGIRDSVIVVRAVPPASRADRAGLVVGDRVLTANSHPLRSRLDWDVLLLSQHTHVPMGLSDGRAVEPYRALAQGRFTRSLRLPPWLSRVCLHFDAHELHHMYPFVPGYRLNEVPYAATNEVSWRQWVPAARAIPGDVFLFQNRNDSGFDI